jgi:tmRNA-binding protein
MAALERLYAVSPAHNATVRTTCVATKVDAGHADKRQTLKEKEDKRSMDRAMKR